MVDEGRNPKSNKLNMMLGRKKEKRRKYDTKNATEKKLKMTNVLEADQDLNAEENYQESTVVRKLNDEILIVDEAGNIYLDEFENTVVEFGNETTVGEPEAGNIYLDEFENTVVEFRNETTVGEPPIVVEDVMYVGESGIIYGSLIKYTEEVRLEVAKENEENVEQSENILYVDEVGSIFLSMDTNTKFVESDLALPLEIFDDEQMHEKSHNDLETDMKIKRLKEEISSLEERIKYIESKSDE